MSLPSRGAWIEIQTVDVDKKLRNRRSPRGERGLKFCYPGQLNIFIGVAPLAGSVD